MTCTVSLASGTVNNSIPLIATSGAENRSQGRALPCLVRVLSIIYPITMFVIASIIFDTIGKATKNNPFQTVVRFKTSV